MLIVFLGSGDRKVDGRNCYTWPGLPPVDDVVRRVGSQNVEGLRIQVEGLVLPNERINTYTTPELSGSYDGHTVIVATPRVKFEDELLEEVYGAMQRLFFHIVHGVVEGNYPIANQGTTEPQGFIVFTAAGNRQIRGRACFVWPGIPSFDDVKDSIKDWATVQGMLVEVGLQLPADRVGSYVKSDMVSREDIHGSYDGRTLTVGRSFRWGTSDPEILRAAVAMTHAAISGLCFDIVHGRAKGSHQSTQDAS